MSAKHLDEEALFHAARGISNPDARALFLSQACGDNAALADRVRALLEMHEQEPDSVESPANGTVNYEPITERAGSRIGPYLLREQIGEGGFGLVFVAEQTEPVKRKVALKVIKPGMDSRQVIARFEAERQALALMDHPNIARVLDAGTTNGEPGGVSPGRPYFVMELVRGIPITEYCDKNHLAPRERLELFITVCQAIQHAHQKGVIHRDVKPSNVLVTSHDGKPVAKVIDFGVAKAIHQQLTERSIYTNFAQMIGTPLYMSPEQAEMSGLDIDTRSDIYSLGVLLYELLTGTTPLDRKRFAQAAYDEIRRLIREEEPPKPSTRLSTSDSLASIAAQRHMEPAKLSKLMRGDLDWITMKALEKDRTRRYETANGLARDIQRYLSDEPVEACPPSAIYRLRKYCNRNRVAMVITFAFAVMLLTGSLISLLQLRRAVKAELIAERERDTAVKALAAETAERKRATKAEADAKAERDLKAKALEAEQKARQQAFAALRSMTDEIVERRFAAGQGHTLTADDRAFLKAVQQQWEAFAAITGDDADSRAVRAEGRHRIGLVRYRLGELKAAETDFDAALAIRKQLASDFPTRPEFRQELAGSHNNRGLLLRATGRPMEAEQDFDAAAALYKQLAADFPNRPKYRQELARSRNNRGILLGDTGRPREAAADHDAALALYTQLAADFPARSEFRQELAASHCNRGNQLSVTGRPKEAEADYDAAVAIYTRLASDFPTRPEFRQELANGHNNRGVLLRGTGRPKQAEADFDVALAIQKQLAADFPTRPEFRQELANSHNNRGILLSKTGRRREAEADFDAALAIQKQLAADFPNQPDRRNELAGTCVNLAILHRQEGDLASAKRLLVCGQPYHLAALKANPRHPTYRQFYRNHLNLLTQVQAGLLEKDDAVRTAETRRDVGWDPPVDAYDAAGFVSRCIPIVAKHEKLDDTQRKEAAQFYADAALKLLRGAVGKGFKDTAKLKADPAFAPLLANEEFKKLLAQLESKET